MGAIAGTMQLQGLMLVSFFVMLVAVPIYSVLVNRLPRRWLVRIVFHFFCVSLLAFSVAMNAGSESLRVVAARVFFVWVNVFGLFVTSVFWSVLADLLSSDQGKRLFGRIAAGGTAGAIAGSLLTSQIATRVPTASLLLLPIVTLQLGLWCAWRLERVVRLLPDEFGNTGGQTGDQPAAGGLLDGITHVFKSSYLALICVFLVFVQAAGTHLYFQQAEIVAGAISDHQEKMEFFAYIDFATQSLTLIAQLVISGPLLRRFGVGLTLLVLPVVYLVSFVALAFHGTLVILAAAMVAARATGYGITVPAREVLFTVVSREDKYKSKSFIDTVVLRGGDAAASQVFGSLRNLAGFSFATLNVWAIPAVIVWAWTALQLGRRQTELSQQQSTES
ncbi:MFS transporter [Roseiconus nitratireducens]|uniref:MFS transporter n=2 Tax=Roseiconus nitratireducens TaxID=2605748 RepID=A0A5M6D6W2_9BACT|nr:MFS transporter [Roseiconus nitratireducens]